MIQPLDTSLNTWRLLWFDLDEPVPRTGAGSDGVEYYLPTCLMVTTASGKLLAPPEILEELDQSTVELLLERLFDERGIPDRLTIAESSDWDAESWRHFALECKVEIGFGVFPPAKPADIRQAAGRIAQRLRGENFHSPSVVARGLVLTARRLRSPDKKTANLRKAIEQDADCAEARIDLAEADYQAGRWDECQRSYQELIDREERRWRGESPDWWADVETRPYMKGLYGRAMTMWQQGQFQKTSADLQRLLKLNSVDNQGVRFLIPLVHLLGDDDASAIRSLEEYERSYPDDYCEPALLLGKGIALWRSGNEEGASNAYRTAMLKNLYIAPLLLDLAVPHGEIWHPNDRAEPGYAQDFIQSYAVLWDRDPAALRFMREIHLDLAPLLDRVITLRRQMSELQDQRYDRNFKQRWKEMTSLDESLTGGAER